MAKTERIQKSEKKLKTIIIMVVLLIIIVVAIVLIVKNRKKEETPPATTNQPEMVGTVLQDTTYEQMQVKNIVLECLEENNETMVSMVIVNTTKRNVQQEKLTATLIDEDGKQLGSIRTLIDSLPSGGEYSISIVLKGNLSETKNIVLNKAE